MHCFFFSQPRLVSSLTLPWTIARFLDPFCTFSPVHRRVIRDFTLLPPPMPRRGSLALTLIPREVEDFPGGDNQSRHMPLPTYLD